MKKKLTIGLVVLLLAGFTSPVKAQMSIGATGGIALPMGTFGDVVKTGFGGSVFGEYGLSKNLALGLNIGYYSFSGKSMRISGYDITSNESITPIVADLKYFFATEGFMPYVGAGLGFYMLNASASAAGNSASVSMNKFGFAPKIGFWVGEIVKFGANIDYTSIAQEKYLGINVGIIYPLGK